MLNLSKETVVGLVEECRDADPALHLDIRVLEVGLEVLVVDNRSGRARGSVVYWDCAENSAGGLDDLVKHIVRRALTTAAKSKTNQGENL